LSEKTPFTFQVKAAPLNEFVQAVHPSFSSLLSVVPPAHFGSAEQASRFWSPQGQS
jgi:hypothetical protein